MKRSMLVVFSLLFALMGSAACAANIAVVDLQKIMQQAPEMKSIQESLKKDFEPKSKKMMSMETDLKKMVDKYKKDSAVMSGADKKAMEQKIMAAQQKLEQQGQSYQKEFSMARNNAMQKFYEKVKAAISKVATQEKFDIVLQKEAAPFANEDLDVTDKVLAKL